MSTWLKWLVALVLLYVLWTSVIAPMVGDKALDNIGTLEEQPGTRVDLDPDTASTRIQTQFTSAFDSDDDWLSEDEQETA
jgi:hypothetical protein